ncbi:MAG TPA: hypothetical protein VH253_12765 [Phycisphaerae bacterium]|nr:hypothetical protein [Phycisphaerae bacterium]
MIAPLCRTPAWLAAPALGLVVVLAGAALTSADCMGADASASPAGGHSTTPPATRDENPTAPSREELALRKQLESRIPQISFDKQPLDAVLGFLRDTANINILVNWPALRSAGIDKNTPITLHLSAVRLDMILDVVLQAANSNTRLQFAVNDNVIDISTADELDFHTVTRVYNIRDLLEMPAPSPPRAAAPGAAGQGGLFQSGGVQTPDGGAQEVIDAIETTVHPDQWRDKGGQSSSIREFKGALIVTGSPAVQDGVIQTLSQIRATLHAAAR